MNLVRHIQHRWHEPNGYRHVLSISLPLVASMASTTIMLFTDRVFLGHYSVDALAASTPAGLTNFMFMCFFLGIVGYVNTFVAQYHGSQNSSRVGTSMWQGIYLALVAGVLLAALSLIAVPLFRLAGHSPEVQRLEVIYFRILMLGSGIALMRDALVCFYSGRGLTKTIMVVNFIGAGINIPLDYALINGVWGFPKMGIAGAAIATVAGTAVMLVLFIMLIFTRRNNEQFGVLSMWKFDRALFARIIRFGYPSGIQFFLDIFAFSFFLFMVGRLGDIELAATNVTFAINTLAFLPMIGFAIATSTLVGQSIGRGRPDDGDKATKSVLHLTMTYMISMATLFVVMPGPLIDIFKPSGPEAVYHAIIRKEGIVLLRFVAVYTVFDSFNLIYIHALKGAGDTRFVGWTVFCASLGLFALPVYVSIGVLHAGLRAAWGCATAYVIIMAFIFRWRYRKGKWKFMSVIEPHPPSVLSQAGVPGTEEVI
ncbi:MAG: MATE family efflux transporter [Verrucomicrobia bacterium]|nr:MATE family efflux transporter [Verrucomicrobiota bacterium]